MATLPEAISFDVGWTLIYPTVSMWELFADVGREAGAALTAEQGETLVHQMMSARRAQSISEFEAGTQYSDSDAEFVAQFGLIGRLIFALAGVPGDHDALAERFMARFWTTENWAVYADVLPALERLRARGIRVGVLSNASSDLLDLLERAGILRLCDFTVVSAIEGTKKPDRRIFERALDRAGTPAARTVHVGDMFVEDILGARQVGIRPLLMERGALAMFPNHPESDNHAPGTVEVVRNLHDVLAAVGVDDGPREP
jgi:putative hydrolase of the HAD superfamily